MRVEVRRVKVVWVYLGGAGRWVGAACVVTMF